MPASVKRFTNQCVQVWQEVKGRSAVLRQPDKDKKEWEFLVGNYDQELLLEAFKLWAKEEGEASDPWALGRFLRVAGKFMQRIEPTVDDKAKAAQAEVQKVSVDKQTEEIVKRMTTNHGPTNTASIDELLED